MHKVKKDHLAPLYSIRDFLTHFVEFGDLALLTQAVGVCRQKIEFVYTAGSIDLT